MIKKIGSRLLSAVMALSMLAGLLPSMAFAADNDTTTNTLENGTYTVTANLYVPQEYNKVLGINAYLTNPDLPPVTPVTNNAKLTISADGTQTLVLSELNPIFTLQEIDGCSNAQIVNMEKSEVESLTPDIKPGVDQRISGLTIQLKDKSGQYVFEQCKEYPTLLDGTSLQGYWNVPLYLEVDFSTAFIDFEDNVEGEETYTISDTTTGVDVSIETSDEAMKATKDNTQLNVVYTTSDDTVTKLLSEKYDREPEYKAFTISMNPSLQGNTRATISLPTDWNTAMHIYRLNQNNTLSEVGFYRWNDQDPKSEDEPVNTKNANYENGKITFQTLQLGTYIVLNIKDNFEYQTVSYPATSNGISYVLKDSLRWTQSKGDYDFSKVVERRNIKPLAPKVENLSTGTAYSIGFTTYNGQSYLNSNFSKKSDDSDSTPSLRVELTVPKPDSSEDQLHAYFVTEDNEMFDSVSMSADELQYTDNSDGTITITVCENTKKDSKTGITRLKLMETRIAGKEVIDGFCNVSGYVLVTDKAMQSMPVAVTNRMTSSSQNENGKISNVALEYKGTIIKDFIKATKNIQPTNNVEITLPDEIKGAGKYPITVKYTGTEQNVYWPDGTPASEDKKLNLIVYKRKLAAEYQGETINLGETPVLNVDVRGTASADKVFLAQQENKPVLTPPDELKIGKYELTPNCPELDNYFWAITPGTLTILPKGAEKTDKLTDIPTAITGLAENGTEQTGVADPDENAGYTITGNKATKAGDYTATAVLKDGYWWMDGTKDNKTIAWSIAEKKQTPTTPTNPDKDKTQTVTANLYLDGKYNTVLPGITVYLNNPDNPIKGTGAPTVPQSDNATLTTTSDGDMLLTLDLPNPVFTLQKIGGGSNASIESTKTSSDLAYASGVKGKCDSRISQVTFKLNDKSGEYKFDDCEEFPTALNPDSNWTSPLVLKVQFKGGTDSSLDSNKNVDTGKVSGGTTVPTVKTDITVKVKDDTSTVSKINTDDLSSKNSITLDVTDGNKGVTGVNLPVSALEKIVDAKVPGTTLTLSDTSAKFDLAALTEVTKAASGKTALLRILTGTDAEKKLSATEKSAMSDVKNASAVSVALSSDDKAITSLGSGKLTVSVPYKWDAKGAVRAYQVDANGKLVSVPVTCKNNIAELTLTGTGNFILGTVDTKSFDDVADDAFYKTAVDWAVENGVTSGISDTLFAPDKTCTRAQVVTFLWRAAGSPEPTKTENPFTDVKSDAYYYKAVLWALEKGITSGTSATTFAPEAVVSRAQVVTFQWRMADSAKANGTNNFTDVPADSYYKDAVQWAAEKGITSGTSATTFAPNAGCTRGQIVTFLYRQLGK